MVFFDDQGGDHVDETKRFFFSLASYFSGDDFHGARVGWESDFWTEDGEIQQQVQTAVNFIKILGEMVSYYWSARPRKYLHESRTWIFEEIVTPMRLQFFSRIIDIAKQSPFEQRNLSRNDFKVFLGN